MNNFTVQVKQRGIKPLGNFKEIGCRGNIVSKIYDFYSHDVKNYFCVLETGKKNCHVSIVINKKNKL